MLFEHDHRAKGPRQRRVYAAFEIAYTVVDFAAAATFVIGSVMFFFSAWEVTGTWFFLVGSILFGLKPTLRLAREFKLARMGDDSDLEARYEKEI